MLCLLEASTNGPTTKYSKFHLLLVSAFCLSTLLLPLNQCFPTYCCSQRTSEFRPCFRDTFPLYFNYFSCTYNFSLVLQHSPTKNEFLFHLFLFNSHFISPKSKMQTRSVRTDFDRMIIHLVKCFTRQKWVKCRHTKNKKIVVRPHKLWADQHNTKHEGPPKGDTK